MKSLRLVLVLAITAMTEISCSEERQVTHDVLTDHELDNNDNFSPDDRFLVFDTRTPDGGIGASRIVGKVEIATGQITPLYETKQPNSFGSGVGAASYSHCRDEVIFIHGPFHPTGHENQYEQFRRVGVVAASDGSGIFQLADARDTVAPYSIGALRGGTHRHEFSGDGDWVGFTYNDAVVAAYGRSVGKDLNLRTIGVTHLGHPRSVPPSTQFPSDADRFSALVVNVVPKPKPGGDDISRAAQDSWIGRNGYLRADGTRQMGRAFIGTTRDAKGRDLDELFIVESRQTLPGRGRSGCWKEPIKNFPSRLRARCSVD